jgi:hypothetical protein
VGKSDNVVTDANGVAAAYVMSTGSNEDYAQSQSDSTATPQNPTGLPTVSCSMMIWFAKTLQATSLYLL